MLHAVVEEADHLLGLHALREGREAADVREEHADVAVLAAQLDVAPHELLGDVLRDDLVENRPVLLPHE